MKSYFFSHRINGIVHSRKRECLKFKKWSRCSSRPWLKNCGAELGISRIMFLIISIAAVAFFVELSFIFTELAMNDIIAFDYIMCSAVLISPISTWRIDIITLDIHCVLLAWRNSQICIVGAVYCSILLLRFLRSDKTRSKMFYRIPCGSSFEEISISKLNTSFSASLFAYFSLLEM